MRHKTSPTIRVLRERDLKQLLDVPSAMDIIERTYRDYGTRDSHTLSNPASLYGGSGETGAARYKVKGATLFSEGVTGIRLISDLPVGAGFKSYHLLCLYDDRTAAPMGLLDETWLHRFRTALTGVIAAKYLARPDSRTVALIGAGAIAEQLFPALSDSFDLKEVRVAARRRESARGFCDRLAGNTSANLVAADSVAQAVEGADIVITLTLAEEPPVRTGMLSPGCFLCSMGETEEVEYGVLQEVDRFIVDEFDYATVLGDMAHWLKDERTTRQQLAARVDAHIGQIVAGMRKGRQSPNERIFAIIQGMAICDLALARHVLERARDQNIGDALDLFDWT